MGVTEYTKDKKRYEEKLKDTKKNCKELGSVIVFEGRGDSDAKYETVTNFSSLKTDLQLYEIGKVLEGISQECIMVAKGEQGAPIDIDEVKPKDKILS